MQNHKHNIKFTLILTCILGLSACQSTPNTASTSVMSETHAQKLSKKEITNAIQGSQELRNSGDFQDALALLTPFDTTANTHAKFFIELSHVYSALKQYKDAETAAQKAVLSHHDQVDAFYVLGDTLTELEQYDMATRAYQKSLDLWDSSNSGLTKPMIINALALSIASQEDVDSAANILLNAKQDFPNDKTIERNLRIITALQQSNQKPVPKPLAKPETATDKGSES